jgi:toxin secretion/phage lysis holin
MDKILEEINLFWAAVVTLLSAIFGVYWYLFASFLLLNVIDYVTGIIKARCTRTENSGKGLKGIIKKVGYWVIVGIAFFMAHIFANLGEVLGVNLGFTILIGWFTLGTFIINEIRSILENLVILDVDVPSWLIKGLEIANDKINNAVGGDYRDGDR